MCGFFQNYGDTLVMINAKDYRNSNSRSGTHDDYVTGKIANCEAIYTQNIHNVMVIYFSFIWFAKQWYDEVNIELYVFSLSDTSGLIGIPSKTIMTTSLLKSCVNSVGQLMVGFKKCRMVCNSCSNLLKRNKRICVEQDVLNC